MPKDYLKDYASLRQQLEKERNLIVQRLTAINTALGAKTEPVKAEAKPAKAPKAPAKRKQARNAMSLREAVLQAVKTKPLTKEEIHAAVQKLGYVFTTKKPIASINTVLYGSKPKFKAQGGKFSAP